MSLSRVIDSFSGKRILILGDVMLDTYVWGSVDRISPESPVPVVEAKRTEHRLGGAANVALNVKALGAVPVLLSVIGDDDTAARYLELLDAHGIDTSGMVRSATRKTTEKTRILSRNQQMLRVDYEFTDPLQDTEAEALLAKVAEALPHVDALIFQDYNKGVLTRNVIERVLQAARDAGVPTVVDPKRQNFFAYEKCTLFKPNWRELSDALHISFEDHPSESEVLAHAVEIRNHLKSAITLITLSDRGIFYLDGDTHFFSPAFKPKQVADVSGAGDTVIAVAGLCIASAVPAQTMCTLANTAAGLVCEQVGVVPVELGALKQALDIHDKAG
jgi:rfaE bifunctional protein kinase chain/domain